MTIELSEHRRAPRKPRRWALAAVFSMACVAGLACAEQPFVWVGAVPVVGETSALIGPRDTLFVVVRNQPSLSGEFVVREDGGYIQPTLGNVEAAGRDPATLAAELKARMRTMLVDPEITVAILKPAPIRVDVIGEVKLPGAYELSRDRGVIAALATAGWLTDFARRDRVFVVRRALAGAGSSVGARRIRFRTEELTSPESNAARFRLNDGDVVVVE